MAKQANGVQYYNLSVENTAFAATYFLPLPGVIYNNFSLGAGYCAEWIIFYSVLS